MKKTWSLRSFDSLIDSILGERGRKFLLRWSLHTGLAVVLLFFSFCAKHAITHRYVFSSPHVARNTTPLLAQREVQRLESMSKALGEFSSALSFARR